MIENIGFSELLMVGLVALLVIGPERLPKAARLLGFWISKTRNMVASVKEEIKEEFHAEEIRQMLKEQAGSLEDLQGVLDEMNSSTHDLKTSLDKLPQHVEQSIKSPHDK
ncbi:Sec-independent protein translocase protein TatB (fragment) [Crenothrix polyspora]|uniref:Sec-independent protein translocase protein TatB n=1 Tax=Crenothrix polyspora TaxID=360316 RepID=A0A1R4HE21_9GAMM